MSFSFKGKTAAKGDFDGKGDMAADQKMAGNGYGANDMNNKFDSRNGFSQSQARTPYYAAPVAPAKKETTKK